MRLLPGPFRPGPALLPVRPWGRPTITGRGASLNKEPPPPAPAGSVPPRLEAVAPAAIAGPAGSVPEPPDTRVPSCPEAGRATPGKVALGRRVPLSQAGTGISASPAPGRVAPGPLVFPRSRPPPAGAEEVAGATTIAPEGGASVAVALRVDEGGRGVWIPGFEEAPGGGDTCRGGGVERGAVRSWGPPETRGEEGVTGGALRCLGLGSDGVFSGTGGFEVRGAGSTDRAFGVSAGRFRAARGEGAEDRLAPPPPPPPPAFRGCSAVGEEEVGGFFFGVGASRGEGTAASIRFAGGGRDITLTRC